LVRAKALPKPLIEHEDTLHPHPIGIRTKQIGPLVCPIIRIERMREQALDQAVTFVWRIVREKRLRLIRRRKTSYRVQRGPPQELLIGAWLRWKEPELLELRVSEFIDEVANWKAGIPLGGENPIGGHEHLR